MAVTLHHIGIISRDAEKTAAAYKDMLGLELTPLGIVNHEHQGVKMGFALAGATALEFLEAADPPPGHHAKRLIDHMARRGEGLFQLCMFSDDYDGDIGNLKKKGYEVEEDSIDFGGGAMIRVAFLGPEVASGAWIEIVDAAGVPEQFR